MVRQGDLIIRKLDNNNNNNNQKGNKVQEQQVPHRADVGVTDNFDSGYSLPIISREDILNVILEALQDDNISRVALHGMGGAGKTTVAMQVGRRAKELSLFNLVVYVHVSATQNVKRMQGHIADHLGLVLMGDEDDLVARQMQISLALRYQGPVLVILDDVWKRLDLQRIGILNDECGNLTAGCCKVLLTSRNREIGYLMEFDVSFDLYLLADEEAFLLLRKHAGIHDYDRSPDIVHLAMEVTRLCRGHPLLISVVGSALRGKTGADQWHKALEIFLEYDRHHDYSVLLWGLVEWSYNSISNKVAQTVFLICAFWPEDSEIPSEDLSKHATRLGLCSSRNEASAAINSLKASCLLMPSYKSKDHVIMHDLVRDAAWRILYRQNPSYKHSIQEYVDALRYEEGFQWQKDLDRLLGQLYGGGGGEGGEGRALQVVQPYNCTIMAPPIPKPSGKLVDFYGLCRVDKSFLPLLKEVCSTRHHLIESQRRHSEMLRQSAFECLGRVLFLLHSVRKKDLVHHKDELVMFWDQLKLMKFDLEWLSPAVEGVLSSAETARIEALREEEDHLNKEAAKLRDQLKMIENKAAAVRTETALIESKLDGLAIAEFSDVRVVSKITPSWKKIFFRK